MNNEIRPSRTVFPTEISKVLARYRRSGLGAVQFAQEEGLPPGRLHYWIYQKSAGPTGRQPSRPRPAAAAPVFQEVKLPYRPELAAIGLPRLLCLEASRCALARAPRRSGWLSGPSPAAAMLSLSPATRVFLALAPIDGRKGFNGLHTGQRDAATGADVRLFVCLP